MCDTFAGYTSRTLLALVVDTLYRSGSVCFVLSSFSGSDRDTREQWNKTSRAFENVKSRYLVECGLRIILLWEREALIVIGYVFQINSDPVWLYRVQFYRPLGS